MSDPKGWYLTTTRHHRALVFAFTLGWHNGKSTYAHPTIRGVDLTLGFGLWSIHLAYRWSTPTDPTR